ncbi:MAG: hypothetical protein MUC35_00105 [Candidatus Margulisbacteria bacterium]|nr:hypothetical protein [Candidatus Margulisiibacteriota bacterium]
MSIRRIEEQRKELRKIGRPGVEGAVPAPPAGLSPVLRSSWKFAYEMAERFSKELGTNKTSDFIKALIRKFS